VCKAFLMVDPHGGGSSHHSVFSGTVPPIPPSGVPKKVEVVLTDRLNFLYRAIAFFKPAIYYYCKKMFSPRL